MTDDLATQFEAGRERLLAVAQRMLGSQAEAADAVQEAWLRLHRSDPDGIGNVEAWLTTVVARLCLDRLRSRRRHPEEQLDDDAHRDTHRDVGGADDDPATEVVVADSVGAALTVVLDLLTPAERVAFVMHDVFAVPFEEIGDVVGRTPEATRQLASRARRRLQGGNPRFDTDLVERREVVRAFLAAARGGDLDALLRLLDPDVVLRPDAAAMRMGALRETHGAAAVAAALSGGATSAQLAIVDGVAGFVWAPGGTIRGAVQFTIVDGRITLIDTTGDVERLAQLDIVVLEN